MGGFGKTKAAQEAKSKASNAPSDPFGDLRLELADVNANRPKTHIFMAVIGKENTGKSAIVFDFFQKFCDKQGKGRQTSLAEFDEEASE